MTDIPLRCAQIVWDYHGDDRDMPAVLVTGLDPADGRLFGPKDNRAYFASWGSCSAEFAGATEAEQELQLFEKFNELVTFEGIPPQAVHDAFCVIPEYRISLVWRGLGEHIPEGMRDEEAENAVIERRQVRAQEIQERALQRDNAV